MVYDTMEFVCRYLVVITAFAYIEQFLVPQKYVLKCAVVKYHTFKCEMVQETTYRKNKKQA